MTLLRRVCPNHLRCCRWPGKHLIERHRTGEIEVERSLLYIGLFEAKLWTHLGSISANVLTPFFHVDHEFAIVLIWSDHKVLCSVTRRAT